MRPFWNLIQEILGDRFMEDPQIRKSVHRLSKAFTEGRDDLTANYLEDEDLRAAYLAYFLPLNFEKVRALLKAHRQVWSSPAMPKDLIRISDFGCGPGTATLATLGAYFAHVKEGPRARFQIDLIDSQEGALEMAQELVARFAEKLQLKVEIQTHTELPKDAKYDLSLAVNVLNELPGEDSPKARETLLELWDQTAVAMLVLEPGHRVSSQRLVRFRERLLSARNARILGPCLHTEKCPVYRTKHWCHFSEPVTDGRLIDLNLRIFKDPRSWLKFSYVFFERGEPTAWDQETFRAIGDLHLSGPGRVAIDLCKPTEKHILKLPKNVPPRLREKLVRGAFVKLDKNDYEGKVVAIPLTKREHEENDKPRRPPSRR